MGVQIKTPPCGGVESWRNKADLDLALLTLVLLLLALVAGAALLAAATLLLLLLVLFLLVALLAALLPTLRVLLHFHLHFKKDGDAALLNMGQTPFLKVRRIVARKMARKIAACSKIYLTSY